MAQLISFLMLLFICFNLTADILSPEQRTVWNPGIPGGIPSISGPVENIIDYGADPTGITDSKDAITQAIDALPAQGGIVYLPQGTYLIGGSITIGKDNTVLRGDGFDKTKLFFNHAGLCFDVITYKRGTWQNLAGGYAKGATSVTVEDGSRFTVGSFAEIQQTNDSAIMYTSAEWIQSWAEFAVGQLFEVTEIHGNSVTFRTPIHYEIRPDLNPQIRPQGFVRGTGFEKFFIERIQGGNSTFEFKNAAYCWVKEIESYHTQTSHITNNTTLGCEYRDSFFHRSFSYGGGGAGYGVEFGFHCTDGLCENNVFDSLRHAMMVHVGTVGCVFGYNYSIHPVQGEGEINLNDGWNPPDISLHGHFARMNLFEGNVVQEIGIGDYWGPMGPGNTFLRNVVKGPGVFLYDHSNLQNLIGNTISRWTTDSTVSSFLNHGNDINGTLVWESNISDRTIPLSYYRNSKPDYFGDLRWPSTGSDIAEGKNPAQLRYESGDMIVRAGKQVSTGNAAEPLISMEIRGHSALLHVYRKVSGKIEVSLLSINGQLLKRRAFNSLAAGTYPVETGRLRSGIYLVNVRASTGSVVRKTRVF